MPQQSTVLKELQEAAAVLNTFIESQKEHSTIEQAAAIIVDSLKKGGKILSCGNGGSSCDAMHFAEELTGRYRENRKAIPAISISDPGHITCVSNDFGYAYVFSRYIEALGNAGDVLLAISTSGNSENVLNAVAAAKAKGMKVVALTGKNGGKLLPLADVAINVAHSGYADRVQEVHIKIIHLLILLIEEKIN
jgi:D-sedoheptulose 7-phosphate isomerase